MELEWFGGAPERLLRARRGDVDALPWGTLHDIPPDVARAVRTTFTEGAWNEHRTALAFAELARALLMARAPVDLVAMAADFVVDEMSHVELNARVVMELGGAMPVALRDTPLETEAHDPKARALEIAVRVSCVGEALSGPLLDAAARHATQPLFRAVLERLAREERAHGAIGWLVLEWAGEDVDREGLARIAREEIDAHFADFAAVEDARVDDALRAVGFVPPRAFLEEARNALRKRIVFPLRRFGILATT